MMKKTIHITCLLVALLIVVPATANGTTVTDTYSTATMQPYQRWADEAKVPTLAITVRVVTGSEADRVCTGGDPTNTSTLGCGGLLGWTLLRTKLSWSDRKPWTLRDVFLHELGHQFYMSKVSKPNAQRFIEAAGYRRFVREHLTDKPEVLEHYTSEWFAEGYRVCAKYGERIPKRGVPYTAYGYSVTKTEHVRVCRLIARIGKLPVYVEPAAYHGSPFIVEPGEVEVSIPVTTPDPITAITDQAPTVTAPVCAGDHQHEDPSLANYCPE